ncbi:hypothetical protein Cylst_5485 [Cylindrospermum stagnale PCC 7417]|uniref:Uncharacterized protein n=1 Tax=Cylindrospermum stagnale PCC 7417 TaxID=56107 RepID=K9X772_9NOST|nr:hypothetical protein [Cylindrospermum stagnale]AFZ27497.1 hypothetical protein Cylst_5485 [Cylindrospermum stagnale PCC 7417]
MQAYKLKGKIDSSGNLVITEPVNLPPGDVEVIVWSTAETLDNTKVPASEPAPETPKRKSRIKAFEGLFENAPPVPADFDPEQAKWEYLKEKHNL